MDQKNNLRTNGDRLWDSLMQMAKIGPGVAGGNNRQALTDEDSEGRPERSGKISKKKRKKRKKSFKKIVNF